VRKPDEQTATLEFDSMHRMIGLKGLSDSGKLYSIGAIMFDSTCDVEDPVPAGNDGK